MQRHSYRLPLHQHLHYNTVSVRMEQTFWQLLAVFQLEHHRRLQVALRSIRASRHALASFGFTRSSAVAEGPRDVHVIVKFSYVVTEYV